MPPLIEVNIDEIALADRPAHRREFLLIKDARGGAESEDTMTCRKCGFSGVEKGHEFCAKCGHQISGALVTKGANEDLQVIFSKAADANFDEGALVTLIAGAIAKGHDPDVVFRSLSRQQYDVYRASISSGRNPLIKLAAKADRPVRKASEGLPALQECSRRAKEAISKSDGRLSKKDEVGQMIEVFKSDPALYRQYCVEVGVGY